MTGHPGETPRRAIPRDLPDQQAGAHGGTDRWDPPGGIPSGEQDAHPHRPEQDVPDTDQAGTGRRGAVHTAGTHPKQPVPHEPSD